MGKKVGILSMQEVVNYGSYLQAYALKQMLLEAGAEKVDFLPIKRDRYLPGLKPIGIGLRILQRITNFTKAPISAIKRRPFVTAMRTSITSNWEKIGIGSSPNADDNYALVIIGSDEVFNCIQSVPWGFASCLYGNIDNALKISSYAASFGNTKLEDLEQYGLKEEIAQYMNNFNSISVRDENSKKIVRALLGIEAKEHLDPVLVYDYNKVINAHFNHMEKDYIVIYTYANRITKKERNAIIKFAKKYQKKLLSIMSYYDWCDGYIIPSDPFEVLQWFRHSDFVITDTFHGTIFSTITHSKFATLVRESNRNKLTDLLHRLHLSDRSATSNDLESILLTPIDYNSIEENLSKLRLNAKKYIASLLESI